MSAKRKRSRKTSSRPATQGRKAPARTYRDATGTTHLVVHRDERGKTAGVTLREPLFEDDWQNDVATAAANTAVGHFAKRRRFDEAVALGREAMAATSTLVDGMLALAGDRPPACRAGCAHCCHQAVGVSAPEAFAIYDYLMRSRERAELDAVLARIREADDRTRGMSSAERWSPENPCPFLENASCSIYEVRPLACRGKNSLDADACEKSLRDPRARAEYLAGTFSLPSYLEPVRAFHSVAQGVDLALHEVYGLMVTPLELTRAMRVLLDAPTSVPAAWLRGDDPFESARGADANDDSRVAEISGRLPRR